MAASSGSSPLPPLTPSPTRIRVPERLMNDPYFGSFAGLEACAANGQIRCPPPESVLSALEDYIGTRLKLLPACHPSTIPAARSLLHRLTHELQESDTQSNAQQLQEVITRLDQITTSLQTVQSDTQEQRNEMVGLRADLVGLRNEVVASRNYAIWQRAEDQSRVSSMLGSRQTGTDRSTDDQSQNLSMSAYGANWIPVPSRVDGRSVPAGIDYHIENPERIKRMSDADISSFLALYQIPSSDDDPVANRKLLTDFLMGITLPQIR
ncbi:hypothetical protein IAT40_006963 [Kwoniella sp. CBS 6097]